MKYFFITFYLFLCIAEISSQPYTIKKLGLEKGLSNNYINDIVEDKKGYLWFATEEGLNKLEGNHFTSFYKKSGKVLNLTSGVLNFPTGNLRKSLFHPFCKVTCIGGREAAFSFINGISFDRSLWVFLQTGGSSSLLFSQTRLLL